MKEFLKANKGCVLAIVLISPVVVAFFEYIFYYHVQYRTENVKCVYDIIGAGLQTCLYQMAVIFIPFTMVYFFKGCYRYGIIIRQTQLKQVWLKMCVKLTKIILAFSVYLTVLICLIPFCFTDCADKLCVYLRRCGYSISSVCDTGGGRLLYGGVYGINDCVCIDVIFLVGL